MNFLVNCLKGICIGAGAILPGISSGVLCVIFGIYEKLLDSVLNFFSDIKKNFKFLLPIAIGGFIGIFIFGNILNYVFYKFPLHTKSIFIGLILGSIPALLKEIHHNKKFDFKYLPFFLMALFIGIFSVFLESNLNISYAYENINFFYLVFCGVCMSAGVIVPGVSNTVILMLLGVYSIYLTSVSNLFLPVLVPLAFGLIIGSLFFMKFTKFLLSKYYLPTFYCIIGFSVGSIFVLLPDLASFLDTGIFISCVSFGFFIASFFD